MKTILIIIVLFVLGCQVVKLAAGAIAVEQRHARELVRVTLGGDVI